MGGVWGCVCGVCVVCTGAIWGRVCHVGGMGVCVGGVRLWVQVSSEGGCPLSLPLPFSFLLTPMFQWNDGLALTVYHDNLHVCLSPFQRQEI